MSSIIKSPQAKSDLNVIFYLPKFVWLNRVVACAGKLTAVPSVTAVAIPIVVPRKPEKGFKGRERSKNVLF
jgi:formylmethanofuran dehydrogenase subunit D